MAYTDTAGNVFETNEYGRPQGYWKNNKYIFPKFGNQPAAAQPVIVEPQAAMQPQQLQPQQNNYRLPSTTANMQHHSEGLGEDDIQDNINSQYNSLNINPTLASTVGGKLGGLFGPVGNVVGSAIGGKVAGRGNRGIGGKIAGSVIGSALLGPVGGLLGYAGGRMGDLHDMEGDLAFNDSKTSGLFDTLGYGFGFGDNIDDRMRGYYEVDQYAPAMVPDIGNFFKDLQVYNLSNLADAPKSIDPLTIRSLQPVMADSEAVGDPFDAIADMFSGSQEQDAGGYADDEGFGGMGANE